MRLVQARKFLARRSILQRQRVILAPAESEEAGTGNVEIHRLTPFAFSRTAVAKAAMGTALGSVAAVHRRKAIGARGNAPTTPGCGDAPSSVTNPRNITVNPPSFVTNPRNNAGFLRNNGVNPPSFVTNPRNKAANGRRNSPFSRSQTPWHAGAVCVGGRLVTHSPAPP